MIDYVLMAGNNRWANQRLYEALTALQPGEWEAPRTGFFPSLTQTMHHIHAVDLYYIDALTQGGLGPRAFREAPRSGPVDRLARAQDDADVTLLTFCRGLGPEDLTRRVLTDRGSAGRVTERTDHLLLHLIQHQIHHRGQAHAMLSSTSVRPPQLDDFYLDYGRDPAADPYFA